MDAETGEVFGEDEWPIIATETIVAECDHCGERRPIQRVNDPFYVEGIGGEEGETWWCKPCFEGRLGDV